ncbi:hypothetical protein MPSI1_001930 [Malassezia psittaci]|uniref:Uncharacterized protein n=1 Tax=Malassezia psittaci TaxID=1821823 RepID=A0AAF0FAC5_9BASI|nr:hypothetical protein MPSI1_001930 [Malassezia psittaci]
MTLGSWIKRLGHQEDSYGGIDRKEIERLVANAGRVPRSVSSSSVKQPSTVKRSRTVSGSAASSYQRRRPAPRHIVVNKRQVVVNHKETQDLPEPKLIEIPHAPKSVFESGISVSTETQRKSSTENRYVPYRATLGRGASVIPPEELGEVEPSDDDSSSIEQGVLPYTEESSESESEEVKSVADQGKPTPAETVKADALLGHSDSTASDANRNDKLSDIKRSHTTGRTSRRVSAQSTRTSEYDSVPTTSAFGTKLDARNKRDSTLPVRQEEKTPSKPVGAADVFSSSKTSETKSKKAEPRGKAETKFTEAITPVSSKKDTTNESSKASESAKTISSMKAVESQTAKSENVKPVAAEKAPPVPPKDEKKPSTQYVPSYLSGGPATYKSDLPAYLRTGKASDGAHLKEAVQTTEPKADTSKGKEKAVSSSTVSDQSSKQAEQKAAEDRATKEKAKQAERDLAEKQARENAAKQKAAQEKAQKEAEDKLQREKAEKQAKEKLEQEKLEKDKASQLAKEKVAKEKAEQEAAKAKAQQEAEKAASSKQANEKASSVSTPSLTTSRSFVIASSNGDKPAPPILGLDDLYSNNKANLTKPEASEKESKQSSSASAAPARSSVSVYESGKKNQQSSTTEPGSKASSSDLKAQSSGAAPALSQASIYSSRGSSAEKGSKDTKDSKPIKSVLPEFMRQNSFDTAVSTRAIPPHSRRNSEESNANVSQSEASKSSGLAPPIRDASVLGLSKSSEQMRSARSVSSESKGKSSELSLDRKKEVSQSQDADSSLSKDVSATQSKSDYPKASVTHSIMSKAPASQPKPVEIASENSTLKPESKDASDKAESSNTTQPKTQALATEADKPARPATSVLDTKKEDKTESGAASTPGSAAKADARTKSETVKSGTSKATPDGQTNIAPALSDTSRLTTATTDGKPEETKTTSVTEKPTSTDSTPKPVADSSKAGTVSSSSAAVPETTESTKTETGVSAAKPSTVTSGDKVADKASAPATSQSTPAKVETKAEEKVESKNSSSILAAFRKKDKKKSKAKKK